MKKNIIYILITVLFSGLTIFMLGFLLIYTLRNTEEGKEHTDFINKFDIELVGKITNVTNYPHFRVVCLDILKSSHLEYKEVKDFEVKREFIRIKNGKAKILLPIEEIDYDGQHLNLENVLLVNTDYSRKVYVIKNNDTIHTMSIAKYPSRNYFEIRCP